jgi:hypothetical protein
VTPSWPLIWQAMLDERDTIVAPNMAGDARRA